MKDSGVSISGWVIGILTLGLMISIIITPCAVAIEVDGIVKPVITYQKSVGRLLVDHGFSIDGVGKSMILDLDSSEVLINDSIVDGQVYSIKQINHFSFRDGNRLIKISSIASDKAEIARKHGIEVGKLDRFESVEDPRCPGMMIDRIVRVEHRIVNEYEDVPYELLYEDSHRVEKGKIVIWKPGSGGEIQKTYKHIYEDGKLISKELISETMSKFPIHQVIAEGQAELPPAYLELKIMESTAYTPTIEECDSNPDICATGMKSGYGVVAVYPKEIPYYTKMYIEGYGYAIAGDCGGAIGPGRIDVFFYDKRSARKWGRRKVKVYVLEWTECVEE